MSDRLFFTFIVGIVVGLILAEFMGHSEYREYIKRLPEIQPNKEDK